MNSTTVTTANTQTLFDTAYSQILKSISTKSLNVGDLIVLTNTCINLVESYTQLTGDQKKTMVIQCIGKIVTDTNLIPDQYKDAANTFVQLTLPPLIDATVALLNNGLSNFKQDVEAAATKCGCF